MIHRFPPPRVHAYERSAWPDVFHTLFWLALLAAMVLLAIWMITNMRRATSMSTTTEAAPVTQAAAQDPALAAARLRYARGGLSRDDYLRVAADLGGEVPGEPPPVEPMPSETE